MGDLKSARSGDKTIRGGPLCSGRATRIGDRGEVSPWGSVMTGVPEERRRFCPLIFLFRCTKFTHAFRVYQRMCTPPPPLGVAVWYT